MATSNVYNLFERREGHSLEEQLELLADITQSFASSLEITDTLNNAIQKFMEYLNAEAASIFLLETNGTELVCRACAGPVDITGLSLPAEAGIVGKTVSSRVPQMVRDVSTDTSFAKNVDKDTGFVTRSILCTPLLVKHECIGALELINKRSGDGLFDDQDRHLLSALASAASLAIHNARMADRLVEQERLQKELELAREIQVGLLPHPAHTGFPVLGMNVPAREVSGDFYDFFEREDGLIYFNLADVSGKGMNAALLMAKVSSLLHHLAKEVSDPAELLERVNDELCEGASHGMFVTIVSGFIDTKAGFVRFANAGHQPPLYHHADGSFVEFPAESPPLGILSETQFPATEIPLVGGCLYLFTDGVTESMDEKNQLLEVEGVKRLIVEKAPSDPQRRLDEIVAELRNPACVQRDDITIMLIECSPL